MTITMVILLGGSLLIYGGWTNRSVMDLIKGDNSIVKGGSTASTTPGTGTAGAGRAAAAGIVPGQGR